MDTVNFWNNTKPDEAVLQHLATSVERAVRNFIVDTTQPGVRAGLRVTVNASDRTKIDISPGWGYTPNGERIWLRSALTGLSLTDRTTQGISTANWRVPINGNGTYTLGQASYVVLRYVAHKEHQAIRRDETQSREHLIVVGRFEVEVLTEADFLALAQNDDWDNSAVTDLGDGTFGLPTVPPFASTKFRLVLAKVTARGAGNALLPTDIVSGDPGISQPVYLTGVRAISVSPNTPTGTGILRWTASTRTLSWQSPSDSLAGLSVPVGLSDSLIRLESGSSVDGSLAIELDVVVNALPGTDVEEPIGLVPRLDQNFPQASQPRTIGGVVAKWVSTNTLLGTGRLSYSSADKTLSWQAPGDTAAGAAVVVGAGGEFSVSSGTTAYVIRVFVSETNLPSLDTIEDLVVRGLYHQDFPIQSAVDALHRCMIGSGIPSPTNAHGLTYTELALASGEDLFEVHQDQFHVNGISVDANPAYLVCVANQNVISVATLDGRTSANRFIVAGRVFMQTKNEPVVDFSPGGIPVPRGYHAIFIDADGLLSRILVCAPLNWVSMADGLDLPSEPPIRIMDVHRTTAAGTLGRLVYSSDDRTFQWRGPGNASFGKPVAAGPDIRVEDGSGDWIRLSVHMERLLTVGTTVSTDIQFYADTRTLSEDTQMRIAFVLWDDQTEAFAYIQDLRRFATADVITRFEQILEDLGNAKDHAASLADRLLRDQRERFDNGITTRYPHGSTLDDDANCYRVSQYDFAGRIQVQQPASSYTHAWVRGRRNHAIAGKLNEVFSIPMVNPGSEVVNTEDILWDFSAEDADNLSDPADKATLFQVYLDEFARVGVHARVTMADDAQSKPVSAFVISNLSDSFPVGDSILRCQTGVPSGAFIGLSLGIGADYGPAVPVQRDGRTVRLYSKDGLHWIEVTQVFTIVMPSGNTSETFTVHDPISPEDKLELGRVAYDGSSEIVNVIDTRRFGTIGARSAGEDVASSDRWLRDGLYDETHVGGVVSGLTMSWQGNRIDWSNGIAVVSGRRLTVAGGRYDNTLIGSSGNNRLFFMVEPDGSVSVSAGTNLVHAHRAAVPFAIATIQDGTTTIEWMEDASLPSSSSHRRDARRRILPVANYGVVRYAHGLAPASPFSKPQDDGSIDPSNYTVVQTLNCNITSDTQGVKFWLNDPQKDGLVLMMAQKLDQTVIPGGQTEPPPTAAAHFAFFRVPAGSNPKSRSDLIYLGQPDYPLLVQQGGVSVFPTKKIVAGDGMTLTSTADGVAVLAATGGGGGGGGGGGSETTRVWNAILAADGAVIPAGQMAWGPVLKINVPASGGDLLVIYSSAVVTTAATASSAPNPHVTAWPDIFLSVRRVSQSAPDPADDPLDYSVTDPATTQSSHRDIKSNSYQHFTLQAKVANISAGQHIVYAGGLGGTNQAIQVVDRLHVTAIWTPVHAGELSLS